MVTALVLIGLGVLTQVVVLATTRTVLPRFTKAWLTCGNQVPPMKRPPATHDCLEGRDLGLINPDSVSLLGAENSGTGLLSRFEETDTSQDIADYSAAIKWRSHPVWAALSAIQSITLM